MSEAAAFLCVNRAEIDPLPFETRQTSLLLTGVLASGRIGNESKT